MKRKKSDGVEANFLRKQGYLWKVQEMDGDMKRRLTVHKTDEGRDHEVAIIEGLGHKALVTDVLTGEPWNPPPQTTPK